MSSLEKNTPTPLNAKTQQFPSSCPLHNIIHTIFFWNVQELG